jgi:hypothetical protein
MIVISVSKTDTPVTVAGDPLIEALTPWGLAHGLAAASIQVEKLRETVFAVSTVPIVGCGLDNGPPGEKAFPMPLRQVAPLTGW